MCIVALFKQVGWCCACRGLHVYGISVSACSLCFVYVVHIRFPCVYSTCPRVLYIFLYIHFLLYAIYYFILHALVYCIYFYIYIFCYMQFILVALLASQAYVYSWFFITFRYIFSHVIPTGKIISLYL